MTNRTCFSSLLLCIVFVVCTTLTSCLSNEQRTSSYYQSLIDGERGNTAIVLQFLKAMPKGGDLHHHYSGSVYAESYLDFADEHNYCIDPVTLHASPHSENGNCNGCITVDSLRSNGSLYYSLLQTWSDKDYGNHFHEDVAPDKHFFNTFGYFGSLAGLDQKKGLQILKDRARSENLCYLETMFSKVKTTCEKGNAAELKEVYLVALENARDAKQDTKVEETLKAMDRIFKKDKLFGQSVADYVQNVDSLTQDIDDEEFKLRFQTYAGRTEDPLSVYSELYAGFAAADKSKKIVGVNIVAPENNVVSLRDYHLHMLMFEHLTAKFPKVKKALHAGELTVGMVRPKNLLFHINEAVNVAKAHRVGHGVDIAYESNSFQLIEKLKEDSIPIEINLTSNEFILGVEGADHPYKLYEQNHVPMVICTDDSGVSRNNLTDEYLHLVQRYSPSYSQLKQYVYNSIDYSFLTKSEKEEQREVLERQFDEFESKITDHQAELYYN